MWNLKSPWLIEQAKEAHALHDILAPFEAWYPEYAKYSFYTHVPYKKLSQFWEKFGYAGHSSAFSRRIHALLGIKPGGNRYRLNIPDLYRLAVFYSYLAAYTDLGYRIPTPRDFYILVEGVYKEFSCQERAGAFRTGKLPLVQDGKIVLALVD